jgi:hypothetical protein
VAATGYGLPVAATGYSYTNVYVVYVKEIVIYKVIYILFIFLTSKVI